MKNFKRVLVAMDFSPMDRHLLNYVSDLAPLCGMCKLYFVHIVPDLVVPKNFVDESPQAAAVREALDEKVRRKLELKVSEFFPESRQLAVDAEVIEGKPYQQLMHWVDVKAVDLLVVGHKKISEGSGITAKRVAQRSNANVLFLTANAKTPPKNILVPIDFSDYSLHAVEWAIDLADQVEDAKITCLHIVDMPSDDYYLSLNRSGGMRGVLMSAAEEAYEKFVGRNNLPAAELNPVFLANEYHSIATHLRDYLAANSFDLMIMGARGHSAFEKFLYGSVTEKVVEQCKETPILVVR